MRQEETLDKEQEMACNLVKNALKKIKFDKSLNIKKKEIVLK